MEFSSLLYFSFKTIDYTEMSHLFQKIGLAVPIKCSLQNISTGYYLQTGIGFGSRQLKFEPAYKIITLGKDKGALLNYNITFGLCLTVK